jgi:methyl-accepting chemotaxis protein
MKNLPIRSKLLSAFCLVALVASSNLLLKKFYEEKLDKYDVFVREVQDFKTLVLSSANAQSDFINIDLISPRFFITETSVNLDDHSRLQQEMKQAIDRFVENPISERPELKEKLIDLEQLRSRYNDRFKNLVGTALTTGFKDYGLTGEMRDYAHELEDQYSDLVPMSDILMLRRHEKDFIIRKEEKYGARFEERCKKVLDELKARKGKKEVEECIVLVNNYRASFELVRRYHMKMGLNTTGGLKGELDEVRGGLINESDELIRATQSTSQQLKAELQILFFIGIALTTLFTILVVIYLSRLLSRSIGTLSERIENFVESGFNSDFKIQKFESRKDEIGRLYRHFRKLGEEIVKDRSRPKS